MVLDAPLYVLPGGLGYLNNQAAGGPWWGLRDPKLAPLWIPAQTMQVCFLSKKQATTAVSGGVRGGTRSSIGLKLGVWDQNHPTWAVDFPTPFSIGFLL